MRLRTSGREASIGSFTGALVAGGSDTRGVGTTQFIAGEVLLGTRPVTTEGTPLDLVNTGSGLF